MILTDVQSDPPAKFRPKPPISERAGHDVHVHAAYGRSGVIVAYGRSVSHRSENLGTVNTSMPSVHRQSCRHCMRQWDRTQGNKCSPHLWYRRGKRLGGATVKCMGAGCRTPVGEVSAGETLTLFASIALTGFDRTFCARAGMWIVYTRAQK
eukprot:COSAG02_NODE_25927_length_645_cov_1.047619_1_plen_152_part_10